jgi:hypothetical protein
MSDIKSLAIFCHIIGRDGVSGGLDYLNINRYPFAYNILQPMIMSYYSLYQCCLGRDIYIDNIFTKSEIQTIISLIQTLDMLNLELAKQLIIAKIRECTTSK